jgi:hypothetical protein
MNLNEVTLVFETPEARREFMSQLSDGWGEDFVSLKWPEGTPFDDCERFEVEVFDDDEFDEELDYLRRNAREHFLYDLGLDMVQDI